MRPPPPPRCAWSPSPALRGRMSTAPAALDAFEGDGDALADADAHGGEGAAFAGEAQLKGGGAGDAGAGHAKGMAEGDGAAIGVHEGGVFGDAELAEDGDALAGKGFVEFDDVEI